MIKKLFCICILCFTLKGCGQEDVKGRFDFRGVITEMDTQGNRILVDDPKNSPIWIILKDHDEIKKYEENQEVVVWVQDAIMDSAPPQAYAKNIEFANPPN